jgi:hypothetical protein
MTIGSPRLNPLGAKRRHGSGYNTQIDYFSTLVDAQTNVNAGQAGGIDWASGFYPKYARIQITAQAPLLFVPLLNRLASRPAIAVSAIAGISAPICSACGIDGLAVADLSAGEDDINSVCARRLLHIIPCPLAADGRRGYAGGSGRHHFLSRVCNCESRSKWSSGPGCRWFFI